MAGALVLIYNKRMKKTTRPRISLQTWLLLGTAFLLLVSEVMGASRWSSPLANIELSLRDTLMRLRGVQPPNNKIVIVAVDDFSLNWTGQQWPWPRAYLARIVDQLNQAGARLVGLDVMLFEDGYDAGGDEALAAALGRSVKSVSVMQIFLDNSQGYPINTLKTPLKIYQNGLSATGISGVTSDNDAIARSLQAYATYGSEVYFNWAFEVAALGLGVDQPNLTSSALTFNGQPVPLYGGRLLVNYAGPVKTYTTYSASDVADGLVDPSVFRGKIVLIGATSMTLKDNYPTPFSATNPTPGVEIVANAANTLMTGRYLRLTPLWVNLLVIIGMALAAWRISKLPRPSLTLLLVTGAMLVYLGIAYATFAAAGLYLPVIGPELMLFLGVILPSIEQAVSQELERRRVRNLFTRFISPEMVDQLLATQDINSLNKRADLTILFSDIRGFTTLSEKLTPEEVVSILNPYLEAMTGIVHRHGGTIDKYEGDAVVAFFGEPVPYADHALRAVHAAVDMCLHLDVLRKKWAEEERPVDNFEIGVGLNTGEVFVGLLGSEQRINYTIIGDNANLASRLQDQTKIIGWPIIVSERTALLVQTEFDVEFAALQAIKGKAEPVKIYKVMGRKGAPENERIRALNV
jgi:adenylate cyclase